MPADEEGGANGDADGTGEYLSNYGIFDEIHVIIIVLVVSALDQQAFACIHRVKRKLDGFLHVTSPQGRLDSPPGDLEYSVDKLAALSVENQVGSTPHLTELRNN